MSNTQNTTGCQVVWEGKPMACSPPILALKPPSEQFAVRTVGSRRVHMPSAANADT
jgi:hypothetical protein